MLAPASPPVKGPLIRAPESMVASFGKYLVGEVVGENEIQFGPLAFVALATLLAAVCDEDALSFSSQQ